MGSRHTHSCMPRMPSRCYSPRLTALLASRGAEAKFVVVAVAEGDLIQDQTDLMTPKKATRYAHPTMGSGPEAAAPMSTTTTVSVVMNTTAAAATVRMEKRKAIRPVIARSKRPSSHLGWSAVQSLQ